MVFNIGYNVLRGRYVLQLDIFHHSESLQISQAIELLAGITEKLLPAAFRVDNQIRPGDRQERCPVRHVANISGNIAGLVNVLLRCVHG